MRAILANRGITAILIFILVGHSGQARQLALQPESEQSPFVLSVVPTSSHAEPAGRIISMIKPSPRPFYVVLTNISKDSQAAFESSNSWGYQTISFEIQTADGHKSIVTMEEHGFRANAPTTFTIPAGEHMVYPITLDRQWEIAPPLPVANDIRITIKAIYEVKPTPESAKAHVWTGRVESKSYDFNLEER
ncbi:MAG TPA: hypothetical protein VJA94_21300 [Candidatus Angelobacter sp.]